MTVELKSSVVADICKEVIAQNSHVVRSDVDQLLDVSQTTASRILKRMAAEGLIYQEGNGKKRPLR